MPTHDIIVRELLLLLSCWLVVAASALAADVRVAITDGPNGSIRQVLAEAVLDARADSLFAVIADVEQYASFVPYVVESSIVARDAESIVNYQRLSFGIPFVSPRHYAIRIRTARASGADGRAVYRIAWNLAPEIVLPVEPGAVAVPVNAGFWQLQDVGGEPPATRVIYCVFTDPGGQLPAWIVYRANAESVPRLFDAVRAAAIDERRTSAAHPMAPPAAAIEATPTSCKPSG